MTSWAAGGSAILRKNEIFFSNQNRSHSNKMDTLNTHDKQMYDSWTTAQKQMYHELKAMGEKMTRSGTDPTTMTQEQRDNPRWRIWTALHYVRGRPLCLLEIRMRIRLNLEMEQILAHLNHLVAAGKVVRLNLHEWAVVDPLERPSIQ